MRYEYEENGKHGLVRDTKSGKIIIEVDDEEAIIFLKVAVRLVNDELYLWYGDKEEL